LTLLGTRHHSGLVGESGMAYAPLDEAIVRAVERGRSIEVKRRLYGAILLLGGVAFTPGLKQYLEWRLVGGWHLAPESAEGIERVEVAPLPIGVAPDCLVWRGGATLAGVESTRTQWVMRREWQRVGVLAARGACGFAW
jgi:actin-related protein 8